MSKEVRPGLISTGDVERLMLKIRGEDVLLDRDVAMLYGVETRDINKAVKNNPRKFPEGYFLELEADEKAQLVENFHRLGNCLAPWNLFSMFTTEERNRRDFYKRMVWHKIIRDKE